MPATVLAKLAFCSVVISAVASLNSNITSVRLRADPSELKKLTPNSSMASLAPFVFVESLVMILFREVPAIVPLIPAFAISPVARATSSTE